MLSRNRVCVYLLEFVLHFCYEQYGLRCFHYTLCEKQGWYVLCGKNACGAFCFTFDSIFMTIIIGVPSPVPRDQPSIKFHLQP